VHLLAGTLALALFAPSVEDAMGSPRFLAFCLLGGLTALAAAAALHSGAAALTLACSGAIAAVMGGYTVLYPRARVLTLFFIVVFATLVELPALLLLGLWVLQQAYYGASNLGAPPAEACGFALGLALVWVLARTRNAAPRRPVY
jgi:membrane associated rhomboid family serine protease